MTEEVMVEKTLEEFVESYGLIGDIHIHGEPKTLSLEEFADAVAAFVVREIVPQKEYTTPLNEEEILQGNILMTGWNLCIDDIEEKAKALGVPVG